MNPGYGIYSFSPSPYRPPPPPPPSVPPATPVQAGRGWGKAASEPGVDGGGACYSQSSSPSLPTSPASPVEAWTCMLWCVILTLRPLPSFPPSLSPQLHL